MADYIYITGTGSDPALLGNLNDPVFGEEPSLGACMTNIRRFVDVGNHIFVISGSTPGVQQYVVGGMQVAEKISALEAYNRFPQNRLRIEDGKLIGNVIVDANGAKHNLDKHDLKSFENRAKNFIVGKNSISLDTVREVDLGRARTLEKLSEVFGKKGNRPIDIMGRWGKLSPDQSLDLRDWLTGIKKQAAA